MFNDVDTDIDINQLIIYLSDCLLILFSLFYASYLNNSILNM